MSNWALNFGLVFETAVAAFLIYTPGLQTVFTTRPLLVLYWVTPIPFAILIWVAGEFRKAMLRRHPGTNIRSLRFDTLLLGGCEMRACIAFGVWMGCGGSICVNVSHAIHYSVYRTIDRKKWEGWGVKRPSKLGRHGEFFPHVWCAYVVRDNPGSYHDSVILCGYVDGCRWNRGEVDLLVIYKSGGGQIMENPSFL